MPNKAAHQMTKHERKELLKKMVRSGWRIRPFEGPFVPPDTVEGFVPELVRVGPGGLLEYATLSPQLWSDSEDDPLRDSYAFTVQYKGSPPRIHYGPMAITEEGVNPDSERHERFHAEQMLLKGGSWNTLPKPWAKKVRADEYGQLFYDPEYAARNLVGGAGGGPTLLIKRMRSHNRESIDALIRDMIRAYLEPVRYLNPPGTTTRLEANIHPALFRTFLETEPLPAYGVMIDIGRRKE